MDDSPQHKFTLFADYFQFYIQDDDATAGLDGSQWTPDAMTARIAIADRAVAIGTAQSLDVPVTLVVHDEPPPIGKEASHIVETDLTTATGRLVVAGCTDDFDAAARVRLGPGRYRARISYRFRAPGDDGSATTTTT